MNPGVGVVSVLGQQTAKGIFDCAGGGGVHVAFHRRQVDDILSEEIIR